MSMGLMGNKCGMTRLFTKNGSIPVTVLEIQPMGVSQKKTVEIDGYTAVQLSTGRGKKHSAKALRGHHDKAGIALGAWLHEFRVSPEQLASYNLGDKLDVGLFKVGDLVDVTAISKGKGFSGVIKRHNFSSQRASHGNSLSHNAPGSIGQNQSPGRVFKGKKMAGQYGNTRVTIQNLEVVKVDTDLNVLLLKGAVPGAVGANVIIRPAVKSITNKEHQAA